jgi:UDP-glucose 4-epimerase
LLGQTLINKLKDNYNILGIGKSETEKIKVISYDLGSPNRSIDDFPESCDSIIHLAQSDMFRDFPDEVEDVLHVNTLITIKLLDYARKSTCK